MLQATIDFLRGIGLQVEFGDTSGGFLPSVRICAGVLVVNESTPVSNLLHEAGHLATMPAAYRPLADGDLEACNAAMSRALDGMHPDDPRCRAILQCDDAEATAWAYAAGKAIGLADEEIIKPDEYDGEGEEVLSMVSSGCYFGVHGLQHAGFCSARSLGARLPVYPQMAKWLQS